MGEAESYQNRRIEFEQPAVTDFVERRVGYGPLRHDGRSDVHRTDHGPPRRTRRADGIWRVHSESIRALCRERYGTREIAAWIAFRPPEAYRSALASRHLFVAERADEIVGFGQFDPARGEVEACYVSPDVVGHGVGADLLARMEEDARAAGHTFVRLNATLNAEPSTPARIPEARRRATASLNESSCPAPEEKRLP